MKKLILFVFCTVLSLGALADGFTDTDISELDNLIYADAVTVAPGGNSEIVFNMKNSKGVTGFQFDVYLPEGVSVPEIEDGIFDASLSTVRTTAQKTNTFECGLMKNGSYRILAASTRNAFFEGTDGEVVRVRIHADENVAEGTYPVYIREIELTDDRGGTFNTAEVVFTLTVGEEDVTYDEGYTICTTPISTTAGAANTIVLNFAGIDENITDIEFDMEMPACVTRTKNGRVTKAFDGADDQRMYVNGNEGENDHTITVSGTHVTIAAIVDDEYKYIAGTSGALVNMYYTTATGAADGIYPVNFTNITMKNGDGNILKLAPTTSYIKVGNPTGESLALIGNVAEEVNAALATEKALATVDMSKVVSMDGTLTLVDGRNFVAPKKDVKAPAVTYNAVVSPSLGYKTIVLPYAVDVPTGFEAYTVGSVANNELIMDAVSTIPANTPAILKNAGTAVMAASNVTIEATSDVNPTDGVLVGTYTAMTAPVGSYVLQNHDGNVAFYHVTEAVQPKVNPFRAYLREVSAEARLKLRFEENATMISSIENGETGEGRVFNVAGMLQNGTKKGVNIIRHADGSVTKVLVK